MNHDLDLDEQEARRLLGPLAGEPVHPSRIDVPGAMAEGRRRRRVRWWATGTAVVALTATSVAGGSLAVAAIDRPHPAPRQSPEMTRTAAAVPAAPAGPSGCTVTRLPTDGVEQAIVTGGDPTGRILTGRLYRGSDRDFDREQVIWRDGEITERFRLPGGDGALRDMNTGGIGVGSSFPDGEEERAFAYYYGKVIELPGGKGLATAITEGRVIVGQIGDAAVRWPAINAQPERLSVPAEVTLSNAIDIDQDGTILGVVERGRQQQTGYLWKADGTGAYLPLPMIDSVRASFFWPEAIAGGWVTGRGGIEDETSTRFAYFRYRVGTGEYERLPDSAGMPAKVSDDGWVLGDGNDTGAKIAVGPDVTALPGYGTEKGVQVTALSADGLVAAGHSVPMADGAVNQPLMWRCRS